MKIARILAACVVALMLAVPGTASTQSDGARPVVVAITVKRGRPLGGIRRPQVRRGQVVRFVVRTDAGKDIHLHGYDLERRPRRGRATVMQFVARIPGRFELELHSPNALLADLTVRP